MKCFFRVKCVPELIAISETFGVLECFWEVERFAMENKTKKLQCFYSRGRGCLCTVWEYEAFLCADLGFI